MKDAGPKIKRTEALAACVYTEQTTFPNFSREMARRLFIFFSNKPGYPFGVSAKRSVRADAE
jgi:hypothetical protein